MKANLGNDLSEKLFLTHRAWNDLQRSANSNFRKRGLNATDSECIENVNDSIVKIQNKCGPTFSQTTINDSYFPPKFHIGTENIQIKRFFTKISQQQIYIYI